jgi:hypothetical protein
MTNIALIKIKLVQSSDIELLKQQAKNENLVFILQYFSFPVFDLPGLR